MATVPKPSTAGEGKTATISTRSNYVNIRTGPGTEYTDIGDIINGSTVVYYPASKTASGWVWVEQQNLGGWISTGVVTFNDMSTPPTTGGNATPTPYDGQIGIWHWKGQAIPENTIEEFIANMKRRAPNVKQIWVKVGDGNSWQGNFDNDPDMAVKGPADVDRWVQALQRNGMEFHAWCVLKGVDPSGEADIIIKTCQRPGVKSMILDVEPYDGYWEAGRGPIRPLMTSVRQQIGNGFHIGLGVDPRRVHYNSIYPDEWLPFINSVHTMSYWTTFGRQVDDVIDETYTVWGNYGRPIIPILQGTAPVSEQDQAFNRVTQRYGAKALSWWRYGVINSFDTVNKPIVVETTPTVPGSDDQPLPGTEFGIQHIIKVGEDDYRSGTYTGRQEFTTIKGTFGWNFAYKSTVERSSTVWAEWKTDLPASGMYQIAVFVPSTHATTRRARYKIHGIRGTTTEVVVDINQSKYHDEWVPLGIFDLVKGAPNAGKVFLNDVTGESDKEIAFDAVRLRQVLAVTNPPPTTGGGTGPDVVNGVYVADGYDSPVGTEAERRGSVVWPSGWRDASPYAKLYFVGTPQEAYHTGADLNWGAAGNSDIGQPVYSPASGVVIYQQTLNPWGNVTIIKHDPLKSPSGHQYYTRFGHMQNLIVKVGDRVKRGQKIGEIGTGGGRYIAHLHFDVVRTTVVERKPGDWPGKDLNRLLGDYVDPLEFVRQNRP